MTLSHAVCRQRVATLEALLASQEAGRMGGGERSEFVQQLQAQLRGVVVTPVHRAAEVRLCLSPSRVLMLFGFFGFVFFCSCVRAHRRQLQAVSRHV